MTSAKRALLTGSTGFVGANLARHLLYKGHDVHLLLRSTHASWRLTGIVDAVHLHVVDLADADGLARVVGKIRPEWVFHLAAYGAYASQTDALRIMRTNVMGTVNLVEACLRAGFEAFVNTGSSSEYGFKDHPPREDEYVEPNSHYAVAKASATLYCQYTAQRHEVHLPTLRLYSVYGPYEEPTRLIPTLITRGLRGELPPLVNSDIARDYVYIEDVNDAYLLAATVQTADAGAVYNVGTGTQTTLRQVVNVARDALNIRAEPEWGTMPGRVWDTAVWVATNEKIRRDLGWQPRHAFADGFRATVRWVTESPEREQFYARH